MKNFVKGIAKGSLKLMTLGSYVIAGAYCIKNACIIMKEVLK